LETPSTSAKRRERVGGNPTAPNGWVRQGALAERFARPATGLADRQNAFIAYAKAALAAAANISQSQVDQTKILLDSHASALGLTDAITKAGVAGESAGKRTATAFAAANAARMMATAQIIAAALESKQVILPGSTPKEVGEQLG
jgi:hypothetical protein